MGVFEEIRLSGIARDLEYWSVGFQLGWIVEFNLGECEDNAAST
jgi:hypothetical protein